MRMVWLIAAAAAVILIWLFLLFPEKPTGQQREPFEGRAFAHRGLYERDQSVPENSLPAFRRAVEAGYGAELDVQLTKDHQIVVFHDNDLKRACGQEGEICDFTYDELQAFPLFQTEERIPLFSEVLDIFSGSQPLIVELKHCRNQKELCEATRDMLKGYRGPACIESFDPSIVRYFRKYDSGRLRGQLSQPYSDYRGVMPGWLGWLLSRTLFNAMARPHFIAYKLDSKPLSVRICESLGAMKVRWTARDAEKHDKLMRENDAVIFERYCPPVRRT